MVGVKLLVLGEFENDPVEPKASEHGRRQVIRMQARGWKHRRCEDRNRVTAAEDVFQDGFGAGFERWTTNIAFPARCAFTHAVLAASKTHWINASPSPSHEPTGGEGGDLLDGIHNEGEALAGLCSLLNDGRAYLASSASLLTLIAGHALNSDLKDQAMTFPVSLLAAAALLSATPVQGGPVAPMGVLVRQDVSLDLANRLLDAVLSTCHGQGRSAVAAVVDRSGNLVALQRDDIVGPHNTLAAQRKAYTALSTRTTTSVMAERARNDPASQNLNTLDELLLLGGGVPLIVDGQVIGALGVAGAGGAAGDEGCAMAAIRQHLPLA